MYDVMTETEIELTQADVDPCPQIPEAQVEEVPACDCGFWDGRREEHGLTCAFRWWINMEFYREGLHES